MTTATAATATTTLSSPAEVLRFIGRSKVLALDCETTGLNPRKDRLRLISLADGQRSVVLDCFEHNPAKVIQALGSKILIAHNAAFDLAWLYHRGLRDLPETICTMVLSQLIDGLDRPKGWHGLAACCLRYLDGMLLDKELQASDWSGSLTDDQVAYAARDAEVLVPLLQKMDAEITKSKQQKTAEVEMRAIRAFVWMSQSGTPFDRGAWVALAQKAAAEKQLLAGQLDRLAPPKGQAGLFGHQETWNWDSPQQVGEVLGELGFPVGTTNDAQLALIDHPFAEILRKHREQAQLVKMYGPNWLESAAIEDNRLYPGWRQLGADSGRTSCAKPNMQQCPRKSEYRACVKTSPGRVLVKADYATLQMRIACKWAQDVALLKVFQADGDPHTATAKALLGKSEVTKADRQVAKSANFGLLFGMSAAGLRVYAKTTYGVDFTEAEAEKHRAKFFEVYPGLARWHAGVRRTRCKETRTASGRRRLLPDYAPDTWRLNSPVQGDEADGLKLSLALMWERRERCPGAVPVLAVHDEICVETSLDQAEQAKTWLTECMELGMRPWLDPVPVKVDSRIVPTWGG